MLKACRRSETNTQIYYTCLSEFRKILMVIMHPSFLGNTPPHKHNEHRAPNELALMALAKLQILICVLST